jgi:acyl-coenzyme A thioesterase PaaI-like protein
MSFYEEGEFVISEWEPSGHFSGYKSVLHGGIQATLLDEAASWAVLIKLKTAGVTAGIDLRFRKPVFVDRGAILIRAKIEKTEKSIAFVRTELLDHEGQICCDGIVRYFIYPEEIAREKLNYPGSDKFF